MYDNEAQRIRKYGFAVTNADTTLPIPPGPKGKKGRLVDVGFYCTTSFAGATTTPAVKVGSVADDDHYMVSREWGAQTAPTASSLLALYDENVPADKTSLDAIIVIREIPADTLTTIKWVAATGGGAAGVGTVFVEIAWDP